MTNQISDFYRCWQADRMNAVAFERYIHSFMRNNEVPSFEQALEIENLFSPDDKSYEKYYDLILSFVNKEKIRSNEERWMKYASQYKKAVNDRTTLALVSLGIISGVSLKKIYKTVVYLDPEIAKCNEISIFMTTIDRFKRITCIDDFLRYTFISQEKPKDDFISSVQYVVPALMDRLENDRSFVVRKRSCLHLENYIGKYLSVTRLIAHCMKKEQNSEVRIQCVESLLPEPVDVKNGTKDRYNIAMDALLDRIQNDHCSIVVMRSLEKLVRIRQISSRIVPEILGFMHKTKDYNIFHQCKRTIEAITCEKIRDCKAPQKS